MRTLLAAACLIPATAQAEIVRVEFEGHLTSVDEGFPIPLAEEETIRGHYLIDTGTFFYGVGGVLGDIRIQSVPELTVVGSSGWTRGGGGQTTVIDRVSLLPGGISNPVSLQVSSFVTVSGMPKPSDGTLNPLIEAANQISLSAPISAGDLFGDEGSFSTEPFAIDDFFVDIQSPLTESWVFALHGTASFNQALTALGVDLPVRSVGFASILGFDSIDVAGDTSSFDFSPTGLPSAPIRLWFNPTLKAAERTLPPDLSETEAGLTLRLNGSGGQDSSAAFLFTSLRVVPEPTAISLIACWPLIGTCRRR